MELKKHLDLRLIFVSIYLLFFVIYVIVGLQPADAIDYDVSANLLIPAIGFESDVVKLTPQNGELITPDTIVGSYSSSEHTTMLIGHSTTVFKYLNSVQLGDEIEYNHDSFYVTDYTIKAKADISMSKLLKDNPMDTVVLMTCAGELLENGDATHRLIITAVKY